MPTTTRDPKPKELSEEAASCMQAPDIDFFIQACIITQLKQTVENNGDTLADREFSSSEIALMKKCKLSQIDFQEHAQDTSKLKLMIGADKYILFSNRASTRNELRGDILKNLLLELKKQEPEMTLYGALDKLIRNPKVMVSGMYTSIFCDLFTQGKSKKFVPNDGEEKYIAKKDIIIESLTELSTACIKYIEEERSKKIPDAQSIRAIKEIIATKKQEIFLLTFNKPTPTSDSFLKFIKAKAKARETEIKNAGTWVKSLTALADNQSRENEQKIYALANFATALLAWQNSENRDPATGKELAKKFTESVEEARKSYVKSVWTEVLMGKPPLKVQMTERLSKMPGILMRIAEEIKNQPLPPKQPLRPTASP